MEWISVKERLPDMPNVLVSIDRGDGKYDVWASARYDHDEKCWKYGLEHGEEYRADNRNVTHWMPYPKPFVVL